ncbi:MAG: hypothetical protein M0Z40_04640 [Actinomycetota bacterium]|jgi:uncharacterized protein (TIGR00725 family)|nr:hypothetical protein [Actinomycetota bacterium]
MSDPSASDDRHRDTAQRSSVSGRPLVVGVMGSASGYIDPAVAVRARALGRAVAEAGCTLITGACPGLPQEAVMGASACGGLVLGISPALSEQEHVDRYASPIEGFAALIYTGSGLMGREVVNIRSSDIVVIVGGHSGTLGEFAIAYDEGRLIGVLTGTDGVADFVGELVGKLAKDTGAKVLFDEDPDRLVERLVDYYRTVHFEHPHTLYRA